MFKFSDMIRSLFFIIFILILFSCSVPKDYVFENKLVTEKKFKRKMNRYTKQFVKKMTQEELNLFSELKVVYDTTKTP